MSSRTSSQDEMLARITELARDAWSAQAGFARQSIELGRATLASEVDPAAAGRAWMEAVTREGARYWKDVGELGLDVAGSLVAIGSRSMARVLSETRAAARAGTPGGPRAGTGHRPATRAQPHEAAGHRQGRGDPADVVVTGPAAENEATDAHQAGDGLQRAAVTLHGRPGDTATGTITLSNAHPRARRVLLSAGRLQPDTGRHVELELRLDPDGVTIPAGSEHDVLLEVDLEPDVVRPGERYEGVIQVTGGVEAELDVAVVVEE